MADTPITYRDAGVDIDAGTDAVERIKAATRATHGPGVIGGLGGFGGVFALKEALGQLDDPLLVSGTDGVGTKLLVAKLANCHHTIGQDLVAMCVNDVLTLGARPLFFLDYFATGVLAPAQMASVVGGIARACEEVGAALLGGETAEMPGLYKPGEYDLAGFAVGVVERSQLVDGARVEPGDVILGLPSSGVHANGLSLARRIVFDHLAKAVGDELCGGQTVAEVLLEPTRLYVRQVHTVLEGMPGAVKAMAHITGGGLTENLTRPFLEGLGARLDPSSWVEPAIFDVLRRGGPVDEDEMRKTFNMGVGFALVVSAHDEGRARSTLEAVGERPATIGVVTGEPGVLFEERSPESTPVTPAEPRRPLLRRAPVTPDAPLRVGVLASGGGSNLQALLDGALRAHRGVYEIVLVVVNVEGAGAIARAQSAGVPVVVEPHGAHPDRQSFEHQVISSLRAHEVELVVLAGFMRVLTDAFLGAFPLAVINVHPALCPAFPGLRAAGQAIEAGVCITGCTVHLVDAGVDTGPILAQAPVEVLDDDDEKTLQARIQLQEHRLLPEVVAGLRAG